MLVHGFAVVGFLSVLSGKANALWGPPVENLISSVQRVLSSFHSLHSTNLNPPTITTNTTNTTTIHER
jgi:hypothetical protein